ncbi:ABC transporter substrate-binding protein [Acidimicrobiia bacterium EGI L10123]|uniref:ABC transporter substrate-binding protein n=1 Tax=Salinilacustrithrix flava TaxID=2957203 RepID=UPI003D7C1B0B|nr:ABC transporter substrate-binding protein [Acidimicrobiia bacterium EGI L10123]
MVRSGRPALAGVLLLVAALGLAAAACSGEPLDAADDLRGSVLEVTAVWQDAEADAFRLVLDRFEARTGATVTFTSTEGADIGTVLDDRLAADDPPDVAVLPQPALLERYARAGDIVPVGDVVGEAVRAGWAPVWERLGTVDGDLYGVWFKAANKSLVWYSLTAFEEAGLVPPADLDGLDAAAAALATHGVPAFSLPGVPGDAWVLTDWFENVYLRSAGPDRYDALAARRIPWTDPSVVEALRVMASLLDADRIARDPGATFPDSVGDVFSSRPRAAMVMEGDFVPGVLGDRGLARVGTDVDVFAFPGPEPTDRGVVVGGDAAVLMQASSGGRALLEFLASTEAAEVWAGLGGFISPNQEVDLGAYPDVPTRRIARALLEAGDQLRFDLSDLQPVAFGATTGAGLWAELSTFVADPTDVEAAADRIEAAADAAWAGR